MLLEGATFKETHEKMADMVEKHSRFLKLISGIESEAKKSELAANAACDRVNIIRSTVVYSLA